jgi:hypothetical protein
MKNNEKTMFAGTAFFPEEFKEHALHHPKACSRGPMQLALFANVRRDVSTTAKQDLLLYQDGKDACKVGQAELQAKHLSAAHEKRQQEDRPWASRTPRWGTQLQSCACRMSRRAWSSPQQGPLLREKEINRLALNTHNFLLACNVNVEDAVQGKEFCRHLCIDDKLSGRALCAHINSSIFLWRPVCRRRDIPIGGKAHPAEHFPHTPRTRCNQIQHACHARPDRWPTPAQQSAAATHPTFQSLHLQGGLKSRQKLLRHCVRESFSSKRPIFGFTPRKNLRHNASLHARRRRSRHTCARRPSSNGSA